jgi:hypothetical protein
MGQYQAFMLDLSALLFEVTDLALMSEGDIEKEACCVLADSLHLKSQYAFLTNPDSVFVC